MFGWLRFRKNSDPKRQSAAGRIAREIAEEFRTGEIVRRELDGHGVSRLAVMYRGGYVVVSWLSSGHPYELVIRGNSSFPKGKNSFIIFDAARDRVIRIVDEDLMALAQCAVSTPDQKSPAINQRKETT